MACSRKPCRHSATVSPVPSFSTSIRWPQRTWSPYQAFSNVRDQAFSNVRAKSNYCESDDVSVRYAFVHRIWRRPAISHKLETNEGRPVKGTAADKGGTAQKSGYETAPR